MSLLIRHFRPPSRFHATAAVPILSSFTPQQPAPLPATHRHTPTPPNNYILTLTSPDKIGLASKILNALHLQNLTIEESRAAVLGADYAMLAHVSLPTPPSHPDILLNSLQAVLPGVSIAARPTDPSPPARADIFAHGAVRTSLWSVQVDSPDKPGIVAEVAKRFERVQGNVRQMQTETWGKGEGKRSRLCCTVAVEDAHFRGLPLALAEVERQFGASVCVSYAGIPR